MSRGLAALPSEPKPPAVLEPAAGPSVVPATIADAGEEAAYRFLESFTANIRNPNTRRAYFRATRRFFAWTQARGLIRAGR